MRRSWGVAEDGAVVEVCVPSRLAARLDEVWPPRGLTAVDEGREPVRLALELSPALGGTLVVRVDGAPATGGWDRIESELALFAAERLDGPVAVHAAVLLHHGRAVLVPGPSGSGKSRLCVAAAGAGATVLSDEYALVDPVSARVTGWPRPVRVRRRDGSVERIDLAEISEPVPVGLVALLRYEPNSALRLAALSPADAALGLLANTVCARSRPEPAFDAALAVARSCPAVSGVRGDAGVCVAHLLDRLPAG